LIVFLKFESKTLNYQEDSRPLNKTKRRKLERVKGNVLIVGVDASKAKHDAAMWLPGGVVLKDFVIDQ